MSADATGWVYRHSPFTGRTFDVHLAIADSANDQNDNEFWMSQGRLSVKARTSITAVRQSLEVLSDGGFLVELPGTSAPTGGRAVRRFRFLFPDGLPIVYESRWHRLNAQPLRIQPRDGTDSGEVPNAHSRASECAATTHKPKGTQRNPRESHVSDEAIRLATLFADLLGSRPKAVRPIVTDAWLTDMDRLLRLDKRTAEEIERTIRWLDKAEDYVSVFWSPNVRSPRKLREKWDQMADQYRGKKTKPVPLRPERLGEQDSNRQMFAAFEEDARRRQTNG